MTETVRNHRPNPCKGCPDRYGWWGDTLYRSKVNGNVYTPATYPDNWEEAYNGKN